MFSFIRSCSNRRERKRNSGWGEREREWEKRGGRESDGRREGDENFQQDAIHDVSAYVYPVAIKNAFIIINKTCLSHDVYPISLCKKLVTTMLTYPWKCTVLHCNHLGNTWKPLVLMTRHFDYCPNTSERDNQSVRSSAPVVSRCFPGGYNVKLYISRGRLAWWLLAFLCCVCWAYRLLKERYGVCGIFFFFFFKCLLIPHSLQTSPARGLALASMLYKLKNGPAIEWFNLFEQATRCMQQTTCMGTHSDKLYWLAKK